MVTRHGHARCAFAGWSACDGPLDAHHVIPQRVLKRELPADALPDALADPRNGVPVCRRHHDALECRSLRLAPSQAHEGLRAFAAQHGLGWYVEREWAA